MNARIGLSLCIALTACVSMPDLGEVEQEGICNPLVCGTNSPEIDNQGFHELNTVGLRNEAGFSVSHLEQSGHRYALRVTDGQIFGDAPGLPTIGGRDLVGALIFLDRNRQAAYAIKVGAVSTIEFVAGSPDPVETYVLEYAWVSNGVPNPEWRNVCTGATTPGNPELAQWNTHGQPPRESIVFEGDRIDMARMTMNDRPDPTWFNIGCSGHTLAKLHLTRNTIASQGAAHAGRWASRQATLKMLTADYCGTGQTFTIAGQSLVWQSDLINYFLPPTSLEARWNETGAMCVHVPRMQVPTTAEGAQQFPDIWGSLLAACPQIRRCGKAGDLGTYFGALRVSGNL